MKFINKKPPPLLTIIATGVNNPTDKAFTFLIGEYEGQ